MDKKYGEYSSNGSEDEENNQNPMGKLLKTDDEYEKGDGSIVQVNYEAIWKKFTIEPDRLEIIKVNLFCFK